MASNDNPYGFLFDRPGVVYALVVLASGLAVFVGATSAVLIRACSGGVCP
jgi:hypothetical protein